MNKTSMKIILSGNPLSTQSIYKVTCAGKYPRLYMTKEGKDLKEQYQIEARNQYRGEIISGDCKMEIGLFFKDKRKYDIDNFCKLTLDSLQGIIIEDDKQIQRLTIEKHLDKSNPRIEICLTELNNGTKKE